ncbi:MAG: hypothetical protein Q7K25_01885 [Actinomycetota bacterium]|nr:hypothetical protein [Actinomycetota bacterium]
MRTKAMLSTLVAVAALIGPAVLLPYSTQAVAAEAEPATGAFTFTTGPGILTTWAYNTIKVSGTSPATYVTKNNGAQAIATFPVVAHEKTAIFTGGSLRITNSKTGDFINCLNPAVDTLVRVVDCVMPDKTNKRLFSISKIASFRSLPTLYTVNSSYTGMDLKIASQEIADYMNLKLHTNTFSPSVVFATGELTVSYPR